MPDRGGDRREPGDHRSDGPGRGQGGFGGRGGRPGGPPRAGGGFGGRGGRPGGPAGAQGGGYGAGRGGGHGAGRGGDRPPGGPRGDEGPGGRRSVEHGGFDSGIGGGGPRDVGGPSGGGGGRGYGRGSPGGGRDRDRDARFSGGPGRERPGQGDRHAGADARRGFRGRAGQPPAERPWEQRRPWQPPAEGPWEQRRPWQPPRGPERREDEGSRDRGPGGDRPWRGTGGPRPPGTGFGGERAGERGPRGTGPGGPRAWQARGERPWGREVQSGPGEHEPWRDRRERTGDERETGGHGPGATGTGTGRGEWPDRRHERAWPRRGPGTESRPAWRPPRREQSPIREPETAALGATGEIGSEEIEAAPSLVGPDEEIVAGRRPVEEAFAARRVAHRLLVVPQRREALEALVLQATRLRIPVVEVEGGTLTAIAGFDGHQGVALVVAPRRWAGLDDVLAAAATRGEPPFVLVLDSLEDPQNLGTVLRSADACGVHGVIFPTRNAAPLTPSAVKASAGAVEHLLLVPVDDLPGSLADLRARGLRLVGTDAEAALSYRDADLRGPVALVIGSEGKGMTGPVRRRLDLLVRIPMRGRVASLNAAVAGSVLLFEAAAQRPEPARPTGEPTLPEPPPTAAPRGTVRQATRRSRPTSAGSSGRAGAGSRERGEAAPEAASSPEPVAPDADASQGRAPTEQAVVEAEPETTASAATEPGVETGGAEEATEVDAAVRQEGRPGDEAQPEGEAPTPAGSSGPDVDAGDGEPPAAGRDEQDDDLLPDR